MAIKGNSDLWSHWCQPPPEHSVINTVVEAALVLSCFENTVQRQSRRMDPLFLAVSWLALGGMFS